MNPTITRRKKLLPFLENKKNRVLFYVINIYLIIGVIGLLIILFYLALNLDKADSIIMKCIPGFAFGIS